MSEVNRQKALKLIRAAFADAAKDARLQEAIQDCLIIAQWGIEDVDLWFIVELNHGKVRFREGRVDYAGIVFRYRHAADFHIHTLGEYSRQVKWQTGFHCSGNYHLRKYTDHVFDALRAAYRKLVSIQDPEPDAPTEAAASVSAVVDTSPPVKRTPSPKQKPPAKKAAVAKSLTKPKDRSTKPPRRRTKE